MAGRILEIVWQRLVTEGGDTCPRCGLTETAVQGAAATLRQALAPLGIEVVLETRTLDGKAFERDPAESNRIWIAGRPLEDGSALPCLGGGAERR